MAQNLATYLIALFNDHQRDRARVRNLVRIERKQHLFDKIQATRIVVDSDILGEIEQFDLKKTLKSSETNYNEKYDFSNLKTVGKLFLSLFSNYFIFF